MYPYVFSIIFVTFRRAFAGVWCRKHRSLRLALASLITSTVGWIGIPFGFLFTPWALFKLAQGGKDLTATNVTLLRRLAEQQLEQGNPEKAIACLEQALKLQDNAAVQRRLTELYGTYRPPKPWTERASCISFLVAMLGAAVMGGIIGLLDSGITEAFGIFGKETSIFVAILSWTPLVAMAFLGGILLSGLVDWALTRVECRHRALATGCALALTLLAFYGILEGTAIGDYVLLLRSAPSSQPVAQAALTSSAVLLRGGVLTVVHTFATGETYAVIYTLILLVCLAYYVILGLSSANRAVQWQQRLVAARGEMISPLAPSLAPAWLAIAAPLFGLALLAGLVPQHGIVDYVQAFDHLAQGVEYREQLNSDKAIAEFETAIRLNPNLAEAHNQLGWTYYNRDEMDAAVGAFQEAIRLEPALANAHSGLGWSYYYLDDERKAVEAFEEAIRLEPSLAAAHTGLGWSYYYLDDEKKAVEAFEEAIRLDPSSAGAYQGLGWSYLHLRQYELAILAFREAIRLDPSMAKAHFGLGEAYYNADDFQAAIKAYQEAARLEPESAPVYSGLGWSYLKLDEYGQAYVAFDKAIHLDPNWAEAQDGLGWVLFYQNSLEEAAEAFRRAAQVDPSYADAYLGLGWVLYWQDEEAQAVEAFQAALGLDPDLVDAYNGLGWSYYYLDKLDEAIEAFQAAISLNGGWPDSYVGLGAVYLEQGELDKAEEALYEALRIEPDNEDAQQGLEFVATEREKRANSGNPLWTEDFFCPTENEEALQAFNDAVGLYEEGEWEEARDLYLKAIELDPGFCDAMDNLGVLYRHLGDMEQAIYSYEQSISLFPENELAHQNLAYAHYLQGNMDNAIAEFKLLIEIAPQNPEGYYGLGLMYLDLDRFQEAIEQFEQAEALYAHESSPLIADARKQLGTAYYMLEEWTAARDYFEQIGQEMEDDVEVNFCLGMCYFSQELRDVEMARKYLKIAHDLGAEIPNDVAAELDL